MNEWGGLFLAVIALATLVTAIVQIGVLVVVFRLVQRLEQLIGRLEQEMVPFIGHLNAIARDASRAATAASAQVERVDRLFADLIHRVETGLVGIQQTIRGPLLREGLAVMSAMRAALKVVRDARSGRSRGRAEEEDVLFI